MSESTPWYKKDIRELNPFKKDEPAAGTEAAELPGGMPALPPELANDPKMKGVMGMFFRKWKDPAFVKQIRAIAGEMQKDGVNMKDMGAVKAWLDKNKARLESGELGQDAPAAPGQTFVRTGPEVGRNDPCHCGSGKKFKKCHGA